MNLEDFILLLIKRYGNPKNDFMLEDIRKYFTDRRVNYDALYDMIVENYEYETFPNLAKIKSISNNISSYKHSGGGKDKVMEYLDYQNNTINETKNYTAEKLIKTILAIRTAQDKRDLRTIEMTVLSFWSNLEYEYYNLLKKEYPLNKVYDFLNKTKQDIISGLYSDNFDEDAELTGNRHGMLKAGEVF